MENKVIAVIDIGSNSLRLQVARIIDRTYKIINEYKATVRIGDNVFKTGRFTDEAIETLVKELSNMKKMIDSENVEISRAVATASFRDAENGQAVADIIKEKTGIEIEIISGIEEARLMFLAATYYFQVAEDNVLIVDMGGGSTEFTFVEKGKLIFSESTPLGCSKLSYKYLKNNPPSKEQLKALKDEFITVIREKLNIEKIDRIICSGGTLNNISVVYNKRNNLSDSAVKYVDSVFLKHFSNELTAKTIEDRMKVSGIEPARADIIVPAVLLINTLLKEFKVDGFYTLTGGLRAGLTIDLMNKLGIELIFQGNNTDVHYARLIETGRKYYFDERHAVQVMSICHILFNKLKGVLNLHESDWVLLEAASLLHDIGQYISYSKHHKHSYYLIKNTELPGFSDNDINIIAAVARYHRRALPKNSHEGYGFLCDEIKLKVCKLAGILRIADGLDRTHSRLVKYIDVTISDDKIEFCPIADQDITMERNGFEKKKDLLERVTGKEMVLL